MINSTKELSTAIRRETIKMIYQSKSSHIGGCFSIVDILAVLYDGILRKNPNDSDWKLRDRFLLSKGHACAALYSTLAIKGYYDIQDLDKYCKDGSLFLAHASHKIPGVELSTGSLGHALPYGCGLAVAAKRKGESWRVFVLLSDGELDEGSNWEAMLFAPQHQLDNLIVIVDYNKIQSFGDVKDVIDLHPLKNKLEAFNWSVVEIDGHNIEQIKQSLSILPNVIKKPTVIIANTVKGKGVDFMEQKLLWHYKSPSESEYHMALEQINSRI